MTTTLTPSPIGDSLLREALTQIASMDSGRLASAVVVAREALAAAPAAPVSPERDQLAKLQSAVAKAVDGRSEYQHSLITRLEQMTARYDAAIEPRARNEGGGDAVAWMYLQPPYAPAFSEERWDEAADYKKEIPLYTHPAPSVSPETRNDSTASDPWREAVLDELIVSHIYRAEHDNNPKLAIQDAISWHCKVALDPEVSSDAQALVARGASQSEGGLREDGVAQGVVIDDAMVDRALDAQPFALSENNGVRVWSLIQSKYNVRRVIEGALTAALAPQHEPQATLTEGGRHGE